jgi:hypothetical protein
LKRAKQAGKRTSASTTAKATTKPR